MAKRKTLKVKDLRPDRISSDQLEKLQAAVRSLQNYQNQIGALETRKHEMLHLCFQINDIISKMREEFKEEYGFADINIEDGSIKYEKDEQANS